MPTSAAMLHCPNPNCQTLNPEHHHYCQKCRTPLPKRYLWAVGGAFTEADQGKLMGDRYLLKFPHIFLDTKPGIVPDTPEDPPEDAIPYLRLFPYRLHIPQAYAYLQEHQQASILLLEDAPLDLQSDKGLMPTLTSVWHEATAMRQLHWLWQMAQLWQPLKTEGSAASLLNPNVLRVDAQLVRLLELPPPGEPAPSLADLGQLWCRWVNTAQPALQGFLGDLCQQLIQGQIQASEQIVAALDQQMRRFQGSKSLQFDVASLTDQGPSRRRNEDSCYPASGTVLRNADRALAIVCDGIGGHEGGNVASNLAIATVQQQVQPWIDTEKNWHWTALVPELENAVCLANDAISGRNDTEKRQERQRMGTTLVLALTNPQASHSPEVYIGHVGDSRVYWITRSNCYQITLDDDVASREVRLGYAFYRDVLQYATSGSLVQALGMNSSKNLRPTVQRFIVDEDCVFLLCSDGLSDNNRVEEHWQTEILPVLDGKKTLGEAAQSLINLANRENGHDNATVGLIYCRITGPEELSTDDPLTEVSQPQPIGQPESTVRVLPKTQNFLTPQEKFSPHLKSPSPQSNLLPLLLGILVLIGLGGMVAYWLVPGVGSRIDPLIGMAPQSEESLPVTEPPPPSQGSPVAATPSPLSALRVRSLFQLIRSTVSPTSEPASPIFLWAGVETAQSLGQIPEQSILQVQTKQQAKTGQTWLKVKVCEVPAMTTSVSTAPSSAPTLVQPGHEGWIQENQILPLIRSVSTPTQKCS